MTSGRRARDETNLSATAGTSGAAAVTSASSLVPDGVNRGRRAERKITIVGALCKITTHHKGGSAAS